MNEALRNWCRNSLKSLPACEVILNEGSHTDDRSFTTESLLETAAFAKLLELRGIDPSKLLPAFCARELSLLRPLVSSCPINESSLPEELGEIHEYLVAARGTTGSADRKRSGSAFRKRSGTFYTPQPVIDEILRMTLLKWLKDADPTPADVARLSLLDPAAGCGAFLVTAYRRLLEWHLQWFKTSANLADQKNLVVSKTGPQLSFRTCQQILINNLYGVDFDPTAIEVVRRILWLIQIDYSAPSSHPVSFEHDWDRLKTNFKPGNSLIGATFSHDRSPVDPSRVEPCHSDSAANETGDASRSSLTSFDWPHEFPQVAQRHGFDFVIGNPPYRRERDFKVELDLIQETSWGRQHRSARMDLWYYFVHRGIDLLKNGGTLSFITNAYWMQGSGSSKLIAALRDQVRVDELFLLRKFPVFPGVSGQHVIFKLTRTPADQNTVIRILARGVSDLPSAFEADAALVHRYEKSHSQLFAGDRIDVFPSGDALLKKLQSFPRLGEFGDIRQGIAENPATINRRTIQRFIEPAADFSWVLGEGVFSLTAAEILKLQLTPNETELLRPYHDLCDLDRYWSAPQASRQLLYSTPLTCPNLDACPNLKSHLSRFRSILKMRRETQKGTNCWWHLHWPRDERIWQANKLNILQMATRPSVVPVWGPSYVPFSVNVFVPRKETSEHLYFFCAILNSRLLWAWFAIYGKRRGIGLDLNGHVLKQAPIARINFNDPQQCRIHDKLVQLVDRRMSLSSPALHSDSAEASVLAQQQISVESEIDELVQFLFGLESSDVDLVEEILCRESD